MDIDYEVQVQVITYLTNVTKDQSENMKYTLKTSTYFILSFPHLRNFVFTKIVYIKFQDA